MNSSPRNSSILNSSALNSNRGGSLHSVLPTDSTMSDSVGSGSNRSHSIHLPRSKVTQPSSAIAKNRDLEPRVRFARLTGRSTNAWTLAARSSAALSPAALSSAALSSAALSSASQAPTARSTNARTPRFCVLGSAIAPILGALLLGVLLLSSAAAAQVPGQTRIVILSDEDDPRLELVQDSTEFWNDTFRTLGIDPVFQDVTIKTDFSRRAVETHARQLSQQAGRPASRHARPQPLDELVALRAQIVILLSRQDVMPVCVALRARCREPSQRPQRTPLPGRRSNCGSAYRHRTRGHRPSRTRPHTGAQARQGFSRSYVHALCSSSTKRGPRADRARPRVSPPQLRRQVEPGPRPGAGSVAKAKVSRG